MKTIEIEYEPYGTGEEPEGWAPYCRLATCEDHGLEAVVGHRIIPTGPGDLCDVGVFRCGRIVTEDVF